MFGKYSGGGSAEEDSSFICLLALVVSRNFETEVYHVEWYEIRDLSLDLLDWAVGKEGEFCGMDRSNIINSALDSCTLHQGHKLIFFKNFCEKYGHESYDFCLFNK